MLRRVLFVMMMLVVSLGSMNSICHAFLPEEWTVRNYGNFLRINPGTNNYKVVFYEITDSNQGTGNWGRSWTYYENGQWKSRFPITISGITYNTKDELALGIIKPYMDSFNFLSLDVTLNYVGIATSTSDGFEPASNFGCSYVKVLYAGITGFGGDAYMVGVNGPQYFRHRIGVTSGYSKATIQGNGKHEMGHNFGFAHKSTDELLLYGTYFGKSPAVAGFSGQGENTEDTVAGFCEVYGLSTPNNIWGWINNPSSFQYKNAFLVEWETRKIMYQAAIDQNGYFRFKINNQTRNFRVVLLGEPPSPNDNKVYYFNGTTQIAVRSGYSLGWNNGTQTLGNYINDQAGASTHDWQALENATVWNGYGADFYIP